MYSERELLALCPESFQSTCLSEAQIMEIFSSCGGAWVHKNPHQPHAVLSSGFHSDAYFNMSKVLAHANIREILARQLIMRVGFSPVIDWVIGPGERGAVLACECAKLVGAEHGFCVKDSHGGIIWAGSKIIKSGAKILLVDDVVTTGGTIRAVRRAVTMSCNKAYFLPIAACLVHRPERMVSHYDGIDIVALVEREVRMFNPEDCELCHQGSRPVRPKDHWEELMGT